LLRSRLSDQEGFTLIELLITLVVLSIGLLGLAGFQTQMIHANAFSHDMTIAATIGTDLLEQAKAAGLGNLKTFLSPFGPVTYGDIDGDKILDPGMIDINGDGKGTPPYKGRFTWTRTLLWDPTGAIFCTVDVTVFWPNAQDPQKPHQLNFKTVIE